MLHPGRELSVLLGSFMVLSSLVAIGEFFAARYLEHFQS